MVGFRPKLIR